MPATSQLDWLHLEDGNDRAILVQGDEGPAQVVRLGHRGTPSLDAATKLPFPRRPPHRISWSHPMGVGLFTAANQTEITGIPPLGPKPGRGCARAIRRQNRLTGTGTRRTH